MHARFRGSFPSSFQYPYFHSSRLPFFLPLSACRQCCLESSLGFVNSLAELSRYCREQSMPERVGSAGPASRGLCQSLPTCPWSALAPMKSNPETGCSGLKHLVGVGRTWRFRNTRGRAQTQKARASRSPCVASLP